ncbi:ATP-dependent DNA helicase PIF1-like protein [Tanacetum coccineum]
MLSRGCSLRSWPEMPYSDNSKGVYDTIMNSVEMEQAVCILYTGTEQYSILLMTGGRTAHSIFHIPINIDDTSTCSISAQSNLGALSKRCKLIIWDEVPMANKHCFEALDRSLRDILRKNRYGTCEQPFGNMTMVFGGDFRQVLRVIQKGS